MGHTRLGSLPKTRAWSEVIFCMNPIRPLDLAPGPTLAELVHTIAAKSLLAADAGLKTAAKDYGLRFAFLLLARVVLSAREASWQEALSHLSLELPEQASLFDLAAMLQQTFDEHLLSKARSTDISEMAQGAMVGALVTVAGPRSETLFGPSREQLKQGLRALSTKKGFALLGHEFFSSFLYRFLNFHLSRITPLFVGSAQLGHLGDLTSFERALRLHCRQTCRVVHAFCGAWYMKAQYEQRLNMQGICRFMAVAIEKLRDEFVRRGTH